MTKETDRELLELAAKAAGYVIQEYRADGSAWVYPVGEIPDEDGDYDGLFLWRPKADDGDALRLAVELRIAIRLDDPDAACAGWSANQNGAPTIDGKGPWFWKEWIDGEENNNGDFYAATRRAIVRAAAEIGRAMP